MYKGVFGIYARYWSAYGGAKALFRSFYFHLTLFLILVTFNTWIKPTCGVETCTAWWDQSLSVLPNLLGFTLGGFAIFIGFGDDKFLRRLSKSKKDTKTPTAYVAFCASFVHFILVQALALICAAVAKSWWFYAGWMDPIRTWLPWMNFIGGAIGYGLFLYSLSLVIAATFHVFRIATMYEKHQQAISKSEDKPKETPTTVSQ